MRTFDGAELPAPWGANANSTGAVTTGYNADVVTVTDQAGEMGRRNGPELSEFSRKEITQFRLTRFTRVLPTRFTRRVLPDAFYPNAPIRREH